MSYHALTLSQQHAADFGDQAPLADRRAHVSMDLLAGRTRIVASERIESHQAHCHKFLWVVDNNSAFERRAAMCESIWYSVCRRADWMILNVGSIALPWEFITPPNKVLRCGLAIQGRQSMIREAPSKPIGQHRPISELHTRIRTRLLA